jgi:formylglycine-generating enzyme required for sulfatase activity
LCLVAAVVSAAGVAVRADEGAAARPCLDPPPAGMRCIPGGPFLRGSDDGPRDTRPQGTVTVGTFYMDTYEVTVESYEACVAAGKCDKAKTAYSDFSRPRQPKVGLTWFHAERFCLAQGKHLPTEAQWEKAARGADGRPYPWGSEPATCERAIIMNEKGQRSCGVKKQGGEPDKGRTFEVGSRAPNPYGLYDMAGNAWEWVADWYSKSWAACGEACAGVDPRGPCGGRSTCKGATEKVVRGGSWYWPASYATTYYRRPHNPANKPYHHFGFRCAASPEEAEKLGR